MNIIPQRLVLLREKKGYSQRDLAGILEIAPGTLAMWEKGRRNPKHDAIENMARALSCDVDYLVGNTNTPITIKPMEDIFAGLTPQERELIELLRALPPEEYERKMEKIMFRIEEEEKKETPQQ